MLIEIHRYFINTFLKLIFKKNKPQKKTMSAKGPTTSCDNPIPQKRGWEINHFDCSHFDADYVWIPVLKPKKGERQLFLEVFQWGEPETSYVNSLTKNCWK